MRNYILILLLSIASLMLWANAVAVEGKKESKKEITRVIIPEVPINFKSPKIKIRTYNGSDKPIKLYFPKGDVEMKVYSDLIVTIDGKKMKPFEVDEPDFSLEITLQSKKHYDFTFDLSKAYKIPEDWRKIEVTFDENSIPAARFVGSATIQMH